MEGITRSKVIFVFVFVLVLHSLGFLVEKILVVNVEAQSVLIG